MYLEILGVQYKDNYASVIVQGQGSPIGEFSVFKGQYVSIVPSAEKDANEMN